MDEVTVLFSEDGGLRMEALLHKPENVFILQLWQWDKWFDNEPAQPPGNHIILPGDALGVLMQYVNEAVWKEISPYYHVSSEQREVIMRRLAEANE